MQFDRAFFDPGVVFIASLGALATIMMILSVTRTHAVRDLGFSDRFMIAAGLALSALAAVVVTGEGAGTLAVLGVGTVVATLVRLGLPRLTGPGALHMALAPLSLLWMTPWTFLLLREHAFPGWTLAAVLAGAGLSALALIYGFATKLVDEAVFTHGVWRRPTAALPERIGLGTPKVSIHVPCYAEPPEVVIATLQRLSELRYSNYEVIVCDNNTPDEALWRPVERFCQQLNARRRAPFKFYHVAPLDGAKAGALNFSLTKTAPDVELIALVDADYLAEPDFLSRLTGFFADEKVGFVQTPHDYLPDGSAYQAMCYWEYMPPNKVGLASVNEYDCAYTIGTMCILRKDAILAAGGWAEWCLTEDSEISIRIRALGYQGVYVNETFGRGLIPETYEDLKKQRFRWTAGPVQQLLAHWRLFLPNALGGNPNLHGWVKLMEVHRSLSPIVGAFGFWTGLIGAGLTGWMIAAGVLPRIDLPPAFWIAAGLGAVSGLGGVWQRYRLTGCSDPRAILGAEAARLSLAWVKMVAAIAPLAGRPLKWRRTPKFAADSCAVRALVSTAPELAVAATFAALVGVLLRVQDALGVHVLAVAVIACATTALAFLTAPLMAFLSEARLRKAAAEPAVDGVESRPLSQAS
jgi:glycosyltransferase involved in cell wall biosynthesis